MIDAAARLRPPVAGDLWLFERQAVDPDATGIFNWSGFKDLPSVRRRFEDGGLIHAEGGCLVVVVDDDEAAGTVVWSKVTYGTPGWACWNIGIALLPAYRGQGLGTLAQRLLVGYLFDTTPVERVEAYTDVENLAEQRALEKVGFTREGTLRSVQFRGGRWRDVVLYCLLRDELKAAPPIG